MLKRLWILCFLSSVSIASDNVINVAYSDFPPFEFKEGDKTVGLDAEIVTQVMARIGYQVKLQSYPWKRALQLTEDGEVDAIMSLRKTPEREEKFIFADPISSTQNFFFKSKSLDVVTDNLLDLKKYEVGIAGGYAYDVSFTDAKFPRQSVVSVDNPEFINLKKIANKRIDLAICEINVCSYLINKNKEFSGIDYIKSIPLGKVESFYIAFSKKDMKKSNEIIAKFNSELQKFIMEGKRDELLNKYGLVKLS